MDTFESIKAEGRLLYLAVGGSTSQGTAIEGVSDKDYFGVYIAREKDLLGLQRFFVDEVSDSRHDIAWYEIGKFMEMVIKSNPTVLSMLFVDDEFIEYEHPLFTEIKSHRQEFVTKDCFGAFIGYAVEQIKKARGLNKKIVEQPITKHLEPIDFCYTFFNQGSTQIVRWLNHRNMKQEYCGLVKIPHMRDAYGVYYDFGAHVANNPNWRNDCYFIAFVKDYLGTESDEEAIGFLSNAKVLHYRGIVGNEDIHIENFVGKPKIFDVRLSSIDDKDEKPICYMEYNQSGYTDHCKKYKEYQEWVVNRNPVRFKENKEKEFDRKNIAHCIRLLHMGIEIATSGEVHVNRTNIDRDFILNVRLGNTQYDTIIKYVEDKMIEMQSVMEKSPLTEHVDQQLVNHLLIELRNKFYHQTFGAFTCGVGKFNSF